MQKTLSKKIILIKEEIESIKKIEEKNEEIDSLKIENKKIMLINQIKT